MSTKLNKALEFANYRVTINNQLEVLKAKTQTLLSHSINGGTFTIDPSLITFTKALMDMDRDKAVILDIYNNPIEVVLLDFYEEILSRYIEVTNEYHAEYQRIKKSRKVKTVLDLNDDV